MIGNIWKIRICALLLILNIGFIWGNSLLPAELSRDFSDWVAGQLTDWPDETKATDEDSRLLRKAAHFTEFSVLGILLSWLAVMLQKNRWSLLPWGIAVACIDETIQMFVPERGPGILDVAIDICGVLAGIAFLQMGYYLFKRTQSISFGGNKI